MTSTSALNQASQAAQVEAGWGWGWGQGWGGLRPSLLGWILLDDLNGGWGGLRQVEASLLGWNSVRFWPSQWTHHYIAIYDPIWRQIYRSFWSCFQCWGIELNIIFGFLRHWHWLLWKTMDWLDTDVIAEAMPVKHFPPSRIVKIV